MPQLNTFDGGLLGYIERILDTSLVGAAGLKDVSALEAERKQSSLWQRRPLDFFCRCSLTANMSRTALSGHSVGKILT
jgi:hypothetical protein